MSTTDTSNSAAALQEAIDRYNAAWNAHDLDAIMAMHAPDMVFANHTAGESAQGEEARAHIGSIFETWPDIALRYPAPLRARRTGRAGVDGHGHPLADDAPRRPRRRADRARVDWDGLDVIPFEDGLVKRKDVYSDCVSILRQVGLLA